MDPKVQRRAPLGRLGALELVPVCRDGARALAVVGPGAPAMAAAHRRAGGEVVPGVVGEAEGEVVLGCAGAATLGACLAALPRHSVPYAEGIVVTWTVARGLAAAHAAGATAGVLGASHLVVCEDGTLRLIGLGAPRQGWDVAAACAPSVAAGRAPTPVTDLHAGLLFVRSLVPWVAGVPLVLDRVLAGDPGPGERAFQAALARVLGLAGQADGAHALRALERFWRVVGVVPDEAGLAARLRATLGRRRLVLGPGAAWFELDGAARVDLGRRRAARQVLAALADAAGAPCSVEALVAAGWPGEALVGSSGPDRLYVLVSSLRELGLRELLVRNEAGYALTAGVAVVRA